ncbi:MAG: hypothetical protein R2710_15035 [Acidimicrobiales bacterium]
MTDFAVRHEVESEETGHLIVHVGDVSQCAVAADGAILQPDGEVVVAGREGSSPRTIKSPARPR